MQPVLFAGESPRDSNINALLPSDSAAEQGGRSPGASGPRILVVDDEALIADTIVLILNNNGFQAEAAYDGHEAIESARRMRPELILSDVLMPNVDGVEAAMAIREFCPDTRIVLFSGQSATVEILAGARSRGHDFELLAKPIHPTQLLKHLRGTQ